jgi:hypothetical protein
VPRRFQDGAATANNPAALALAEARLLWPDVPIDALVSLGSGIVPMQRREKSMSAYLDIGSVLIEARLSSLGDMKAWEGWLVFVCCRKRLNRRLTFDPMRIAVHHSAACARKHGDFYLWPSSLTYRAMIPKRTMLVKQKI